MGDRALNEDEDNSDEEHENASSFQSPALIYALTQVKRVREQLAGANISVLNLLALLVQK